MMLVNTDYISGKEFEMLGMVKGSVVNIIYAISSILNGTSEVICYGTAVKFK
ncbi:MAG: hypothetical protein E6344_04020 [Clostridium sp.]|nr:hypothetical protein [Clostridium sp.]MDU7082831.1 hypothetical protein [Clostridium sp.]